MNVLTLIRISLRIAFTTLVSSTLTLKAAAHDLPLNAYELQSHHLQMVDDCIGTNEVSKHKPLRSDSSDSKALPSPQASPASHLPLNPPLLTSSQRLWFSGVARIVFAVHSDSTQRLRELYRASKTWSSEGSLADSPTNLTVLRPTNGVPPSPASHQRVLAKAGTEAMQVNVSALGTIAEVTMTDFVQSFAILHNEMDESKLHEGYLSYDLSVRDWCFRGGYGFGVSQRPLESWHVDQQVGRFIDLLSQNMRQRALQIVRVAGAGRNRLDHHARELTAAYLEGFVGQPFFGDQIQGVRKYNSRRPYFVEPNLVWAEVNGIAIVMTRQQASQWGYASATPQNNDPKSHHWQWKELGTSLTKWIASFDPTQNVQRLAQSGSPLFPLTK